MATINRDKLTELFVEALPSLRLSRPSLAAELSEWRVCFAQHFLQIKKSGPASESHIAYLLLERLFVDGDEDVREEARLLFQSILAESHHFSLTHETLIKDFGPETLKAMAPEVIAEAARPAPTKTVWIPSFWELIGLVFGFTAWIPIVVMRILDIENGYMNGAAWTLAGVALGMGIHFGYRKKI